MDSNNLLSGTFKEWGGKIQAQMGQMTYNEHTPL
jgi:uncharacterized protein YjbJ (UPF0337 family)